MLNRSKNFYKVCTLILAVLQEGWGKRNALIFTIKVGRGHSLFQLFTCLYMSLYNVMVITLRPGRDLALCIANLGSITDTTYDQFPVLQKMIPKAQRQNQVLSTSGYGPVRRMGEDTILIPLSDVLQIFQYITKNILSHNHSYAYWTRTSK